MDFKNRKEIETNMREPIRILYWGMTSNIGGIESFIMNVYRNIDRTKVQIDFLLNHAQEKIAFEDEIINLGGKIYRIMYSERESLIKSRTELDKFFREHSEFKAVHIHANFPYAFPLKYAKKYKIPLRILHSHNSNEDKNRGKGIKQFLRQLRKVRVKRQINKYPNMYIACSDLAANFMFPMQKYVWIKNGIDINKYKFNQKVREEIRKEIEANQDTYVIGFIGRLREQKNPFFLIDVYREYLKLNHNSKLVIAGIGEWEAEVKKYAADLIGSKHILFLGQRTDAEKLYQGFDCFLLPSLYEGLPVVLVEAQVAGLRCVVSDVITRQVDVTDLVEYYSLKKSAKEWANVIETNRGDFQMKNRENYSQEMFEQGFDVRSVAKELEMMYLEQK